LNETNLQKGIKAASFFLTLSGPHSVDYVCSGSKERLLSEKNAAVLIQVFLNYEKVIVLYAFHIEILLIRELICY